MTATMFPWLRTFHILFAASWFGAAAFLTFYLLPVARGLGPSAAATMQALQRRGAHRFMAASAGLTVLSGLWLYWMLTVGFDPRLVATAPGLTFGLGGLAGLLAAVLGGAVIGRGLQRIDALATPDAGADAGERERTIAALQRRVALASRLALLLLFIAVLAMTLGHGI